ncbi:MAG: ATP-binding cassette domain-containing protein [Coprobacillaceae bacterium]
MESIITFENITKQYDDKTILEDFNLSIAKGEFLTIIGSSGSGKTTILKMINGLILPTSGTIKLHNRNIQDDNIIDIRRNIGYVIQGSVLFPHLSVAENILYVPHLNRKKDKDKDIDLVKKWLSIVGLDEELMYQYPDQLSGGQQQRVGIARALVTSPEIVLMDEPFGAVDEITRSQLQKEIKDIHAKTGVTIIFITHDIKEALKLGTKVVVMNEGKIEQYDSPTILKDAPATPYVVELLENIY